MDITLIRGGGGYVHILMFCPKKSVGLPINVHPAVQWIALSNLPTAGDKMLCRYFSFCLFVLFKHIPCNDEIFSNMHIAV